MNAPRTLGDRLGRTIVLASSSVTLVALVAGVLVGAGIVLRQEDATSVAMARVFQSELSRYGADPARANDEIRDEIAEQQSFGRQIEVWRAGVRVAAGPRTSLLESAPSATSGCASLHASGELWRVCTEPAAGGVTVVVAAPLGPLFRGLGTFALAVIVAALLGMLVFAAIGRRTVARMVRPVDDLRAAVERIEGARPEARVGSRWGLAELDSLAAAFDALLARIEAAGQRERRFLFDASHELRTPLTRLRAQLEAALAEAPADSELRARIAAAERSCATLVHVSESVLALARGELPSQETVNVSDVARALLADRFANDAARLSLAAPDEALVRADADLVALALGNIIDNALKYSSGAVSVEVQCERDAVAVAVTDEGPGIPADERARVLEPFYRGDSARGGVPGTGLGLALARHVAVAYGGGIELSDGTPRGLRVVWRLPGWVGHGAG